MGRLSALANLMRRELMNSRWPQQNNTPHGTPDMEGQRSTPGPKPPAEIHLKELRLCGLAPLRVISHATTSKGGGAARPLAHIFALETDNIDNRLISAMRGLCFLWLTWDHLKASGRRSLKRPYTCHCYVKGSLNVSSSL